MMMPLSSSALSEALTEAAWRSALLNLECASLQPFRALTPGCYVGPWEDSYDFVRVLLLPRLLQVCAVKGAPLLFAPTVGKVWVTGSEDSAGLLAVLTAIEAYFSRARQPHPTDTANSSSVGPGPCAVQPWVARRFRLSSRSK